MLTISGYTGQLNNLDYTVCIDQEYGFCGTEFYQELEPGSFSMTNKTELSDNFQVWKCTEIKAWVYIFIVLQDVNIEGARNGDACHADYLLIPGGHCKVKQICLGH